MATSLRVNKTNTPNVDTYGTPATTSTDVLEDDLFIQEDETQSVDHSSMIQTGWSAAKKAVANSSKSYDKKTGPLNRPDMYYAVSKTGQGTKTSYSIVPVKERDLAEEWDIDPVAAAELIKTLKPFGPEALHTSTKAELADIAREIAGNN